MQECHDLSEKEREIIRLLAKYNLRVASVARRMHYQHHSIGYHVDKIKNKTGLDPTNFYDMIKLLKIIGEWKEAA